MHQPGLGLRNWTESTDMKILLPGGSGYVGTLLARNFHARGHDVTVLSRTLQPAAWRVLKWDGVTLGDWACEVNGADVVINLAGRSVNCRYNARNRQDILDSRVKSTNVVGEAIQRAQQQPSVWLQMSTATIYAHRYDVPNDECNGLIGGSEVGAPDTWRFSIDVAKAWENAANKIDVRPTRKVLLRTAMVMSPESGGVFDALCRLVKFGLGGPVAGGHQYVSWIHHHDFVRAIDWLIDHPELHGPINLSSPNPLPFATFMRALRHACRVSVGLPATRWMLEMGALLLQTETELILKSRRVVPGKLLHSGFQFDFAEWTQAARELCAT